MIADYDESFLPWPVKPLIKLDYCWRLNYLMFKHSIVLAVPMTMVYTIFMNIPRIWKMTFKTFPKLLTAINYCACVILMTSGNLFFSLLTEDYW